MAIDIIRTTGADPRSLALRTSMDDETYGIYADTFAALPPEQLEKVSAALHTDQADLVDVVIATEDGTDLGHAALRALVEGGFEVKKVYVRPEARGRGISRTLMTAIEGIAREKGEQRILLQTGPRQLEAISLYEKSGYEHIGEFGPYVGLSDMVYMAKAL